ncbi:hypothetical protein F1C10_08475 [Sphingomonas sp. NBWT7]|uniref:hypothetical protein n=1 Tax=Sphingomonas sp. NBWT7 TaxID=2596913 RepID=UPI0016293704|nr:hypothetical protein [Sphingomonas sp. NBWT7]QNE31969.1 hypothetical protein F1C10_08475 [Sphingomonas sp. NBWT7]
MILAVALLLAGERTAIGVYDAWGAFRDGDPARCYAISKPLRAGGSARLRPFASVAAHFGRDGRPAIYIRLSSARSAGAPATLAIGERRFTLPGNARAAWAPDAATDRAIVAAMRGGRSMSVSAVSASGRAFADSYALGGAATAIDAATLGCLG